MSPQTRRLKISSVAFIACLLIALSLRADEIKKADNQNTLSFASSWVVTNSAAPLTITHDGSTLTLGIFLR